MSVSGAPGSPSSPIYDEIGLGYARCRRADPRLAEPIFAALEGASTVLDVGAGAGSYEPRDRRVVAVDPSGVMLSQQPKSAAPAIRAAAEALPFPSGSFDAVMAVLTVHHWPDRSAGFAELRRVARLRVVLTFDPAVHNRMWLMDYVTEVVRLESARAPSIDEVYAAIEGRFVAILPVPHDCLDAMTIANWRHPEAYFDPAVRAGGSALRQVDRAALQRGLDQLAEDLRTGRWFDRYGDLLGREQVDCGLRLVVGERPSEAMLPKVEGDDLNDYLDRVLVGGREKRQVVIVDYDPTWPERFEQQKTRISSALGRKARRIEHIGSTAVPGLVAKPVVDIVLVVDDVDDEASYHPPLEQAGYVLRVREPGHRMFRTPELDVHVHVWPVGSAEIERHLLFRDWLRINEGDRLAYEAVKRRLTNRDWEDMNHYANAKGDVIADIMTRARAWAESSNWTP